MVGALLGPAQLKPEKEYPLHHAGDLHEVHRHTRGGAGVFASWYSVRFQLLLSHLKWTTTFFSPHNVTYFGSNGSSGCTKQHDALRYGLSAKF